MRKLFFILALLLWAPLRGEDTVIKGDTMELQDQGQRVLFRGGVKLTRGADILRAHEMETNKGRDKVTATGNVELFRVLSPSEKLKGYGRKGFYDTNGGEGYLLGGKEQTHLIYSQVVSSSMTRVLDLFADRFDFVEETSTAVATGRVYGRTIDPESHDLLEFWSEQAYYDGNTKTLTLLGPEQAKARQITPKGHRTLTGDVITYFVDLKSFTAKGRAQGVFVDSKNSEVH